MIFYPDYSDIPAADVEAFVQSCEMGRLVTVDGDGQAHVGLYPFLYDGATIEMHLHRKDEQLLDLRSRPRCVFGVDEVLGTIPSYWVDPDSAVMATAYHRSVLFECEASIDTEEQAIAFQQTRLLHRYQPEGGYRPLNPEDPIYRAALGHIAALRLRVLSRKVKFKLAQNRSPETRRRVIEKLRARGRHDDARAAAALEWTLGGSESR